MKNKLTYSVLLAGLLVTSSCKDYLDYQPQGLLSSETIQSASGADALVTAAYAGIGNDDMIGPMTSMWVYGSVRSDDAYKGGGGVGDVAEVDFYEHYNLTRPDMGLMHPYTWENFYK
ncbi:MAG TPA: RagB/SusD family nutrient uptake outer membrane protein, partial [Fibrella sp.]